MNHFSVTDYLPMAPNFGLVHRSRLTDLIDLPYQAAITIVTAGPGFGKSSLLVDWSASQTRPAVWLRLRSEDNSPYRLRDRVMEAIRQSTAEAMSFQSWEHVRPTATTCACRDGSDDVPTIVIDNAESIASPAAIDWLNQELGEAEGGARRFVLLTRRPLALRLGRLRAIGQVREIDARQLKFTLDETRNALAIQLGANYDDARTEWIWRQLEGWPAGIYLAGMAIQRAEATEGGEDAEVSAFRQYLDEFVEQEILSPLSPGERKAILQLAILSLISPGMAEVVLDDAEAGIVARLVSAFPFSSKPGLNGADAFRIHCAVHESLRRISARDLTPGVRERTAIRAAAWFRQHGDTGAAANVVMGVGGGAWIYPTILEHARQLVARSRFEELSALLQNAPADLVESFPEVGYWEVLAKLAIGQTHGMEAKLSAFVPMWSRIDGDSSWPGRIALSEGIAAYWRNDQEIAIAQLDAALSLLPSIANAEQMYAATFRGRIETRAGNDDASRTFLSMAEQYAAWLPIDEQWAWRIIAPDRANTYALRGDLAAAIGKYEQILAEMPATQAEIEGHLRCRLISLEIERDNMEAARHHLEILETISDNASSFWRHDAVIARVRYDLAIGETMRARVTASGAIKAVRRHPAKDQMVMQLARIWLVRGEYPLVQSWIDDVKKHTDPWIDVFGDYSLSLLEIDYALASGEPATAANIAEEMMTMAAGRRRWSEYVSYASRLAVALNERGSRRQARKVWEQAVTRGVKGGFVRSFVAPGVDVASVFSDTWGKAPSSQRLREALRSLAGAGPTRQSRLLTGREREVMSLVAAGLSNQEIASQLYLSVNTVRNHLGQVYSRLGVHSRSAAVARARTLGLIA